ncbi:MAG: hypothetical protein L0Y44_03465 [Phycisphaerales bacterium]|nr:hypothetical protein [Phycisphaerales bacterium]MCI0629695.1 hypothetical protein [Phycisphaerales bacterium]
MLARAPARTPLLTACILVFICALAPAAHLLLHHRPQANKARCLASAVCNDRPASSGGHDDERNHDENGCAVCAILGFKYVTVHSQPVHALTICTGAPPEYFEQVSELFAPRNTPIRGPPFLHVI